MRHFAAEECRERAAAEIGASPKYMIALYCDPEIGPCLPDCSQWSAVRCM
jgi:hypothetical protein